MSLLKSNSVQIGQSTTGTNNFTLSVPSSPDGTIKLARGNSGETTADILSVDASGNVTTTLASGTVKFSQLSTSATEADNVAKRTAKAWVNFDGTTNTGGNCTIRDDFNVSTVADNGTGNYTVNFSSPLTTSSYACVAQGDGSNTGGAHGFVIVTPLTTSSFGIQFLNSPGTRLDAGIISAVVLL
jgi:hypothetical protein